MVLPTEIVRFKLGGHSSTRLEVIDICNLLTRGLRKRDLNLTIQSHMVKRFTTITSKEEGTCFNRINIQTTKPLSHDIHFSKQV